MKVYISNYRSHWLSPYTILQRVCFWEKDKNEIFNLDDDPNNKYQKWVDLLEPICVGIQKFLDLVHPRIEYVKIDKFDTWNMDRTLAMIALPMLKQLKETKHGSQIVDLEDVPEYMRTTTTTEYDSQQCFDFYKEDKEERNYDIHGRWDWVLDEMIFAFESRFNDWDSKYFSGNYDMKSVPCQWDENGKPTLFTFEEGPNHTSKFDNEGYQKENERIQNGFRLFGKYYNGLWD